MIKISIKYLLVKIKYILKKRDMDVIIKFFRSKGIKIGEECNIYSDIVTSEPELITIGNNVTISNDVQFITHDNSVSKVFTEYTDIFGEITIGDNCFIGARAIILPGVEISNNTIVGSGSVVTKSFSEDGIVIGGNPAKKICDISQYSEKVKNNLFNINNLTNEETKELLRLNKDKFIRK